MGESQGTRWSYTLHDWTEEELQGLLGLDSSYHVVGREVCPTSGRPHLQGFVILSRKKRLSALKRAVGIHRLHLALSRGTPEQNRVYCTKDNDFEERGSCPASNGKRKRDEIATDFVAHAERGELVEFAESNPGVWHYDGDKLWRNYVSLVRPGMRQGIDVLWLFGSPGVGKSRRAWAKYPDAYPKVSKHKWWSGYRFEDEVIIDDFKKECIDIQYLLTWFDYYPCYVETKGGMMALKATKFIVTSNFTPEDIYWNEPNLDALLRRVKKIELK